MDYLRNWIPFDPYQYGTVIIIQGKKYSPNGIPYANTNTNVAHAFPDIVVKKCKKNDYSICKMWPMLDWGFPWDKGKGNERCIPIVK